MYDRKYLRSKGVWAGDFKAIWSKEFADLTPRQRGLLELIRNRNNDGYRMGLEDWRAFHAIDLAYEVPFNQTTATFVHHLLSKQMSNADMLRELQAFGLKEDDLFLDVVQDGRKMKILNQPILWQTFIPIVKAYVSIRLAKLFNERNTNPIIPFKPILETSRDQALCQIWGHIINKIGTAYGYSTVLRQAILQTLKYGICLAFPREEWHVDEQMIDFGNGAEKTIIKEGIRYILPHPTRQFFDLNYPATTFNTDSGCEFAGHWTVIRYGDVLDNRMYWNRRKIFAGTNWFQCPGAEQYFKEVFPCQLKFPVQNWGSVTRDDKAAWYTNNDRDMAVFVATQFVKLIPKNYDLGDYKYPVWLRFDLAGSDTVIWSDVCAYNPVLFMGYDWDENAARNSSLALELIPWQDQLGNILSQMLLTAKQNLANVIFYNNQAVDKGDIDKLNNSGEQKYRTMNFIGYDAMKMAAARIDVDKVFHSVQFNRQSIQEFLQMMPMLLTIMERVIQMAAQEAGAAASHQQSKAEIVETGGASSNRVMFTGSFVDEFIDAWGKQNHDAALAYLDPEFIAQVSADIPNIDQALQVLGFKVLDRNDTMITVQGKKNSLRVESFAATYKVPDAAKEKEMAQVIFQTVGVIAGQQDLHQKVGARNMLKMLERGAILAGAPTDFRLEYVGDGPGDIPQAVLQAIQQAQQATLQTVEQKIGAPAAQASARDEQRIGTLEEVVKKLQAIYQIASDAQNKTRIKEAETAQKMQIQQQEFAAEERRKDERHQQDMQRKAQETAAGIQLEKVKAATEIQIDKAKAVTKLGVDKAHAANKLEADSAKAKAATKAAAKK